MKKIYYNPSSVRMGVAIEKEHRSTITYIKNFYRKYKKFPSNKSIYKHITFNHLKENPNYYLKLKKCKL